MGAVEKYIDGTSEILIYAVSYHDNTGFAEWENPLFAVLYSEYLAELRRAAKTRIEMFKCISPGQCTVSVSGFGENPNDGATLTKWYFEFCEAK